MGEPYRILVTGSRDWDDAPLLSYQLGLAVMTASGIGRSPLVVHGAARGADLMAAGIAAAHCVRCEPHPADWDLYGKAAGYRRNAEMVAAGADVCLAFIRNGSRGASHCAGLAEKAGIDVHRFVR